ncbi:MAG: Cadmium-transporting ATPase [Chlamydiia bacterium]|nr:Cadmium-transporting ATPase [Chlamydiia bacterium]MCH9616202.1 Cadmium-transporting ATPase [Chlamydiia bacterium]MCH9629812.1 Cadmium-transporting ATPase [Chlamydiia bacterium]
MKKVIKIRGHLCSSEIPLLQQTLSKFTPHYTIDIVGKIIFINDPNIDESVIVTTLLEKGVKARVGGQVGDDKADFMERFATIGIALGSLVFILFKVYILAIILGCLHVVPKVVHSLKNKRIDINVLMLVAVSGAVAIGQHFEGSIVIFLYIVAHILEDWSAEKAKKAIQKLLDLAPSAAILETGEEVPVDVVEIGTRVVVKPGDKIPIDGVIVEGSTSINQAPITGESTPVDKEVGDEVFAGTINESGALIIQTTKVASDSTLARIIQMVGQAQSRRALIRQWVEKFAHVYTPAMIIVAILIAVVPPLFRGNWLQWFYEALVILVIACPCALVISTPVTLVSGLSSAARNGILIKGGIFMEIPASLKTIAFDKTGTLTEGKPVVTAIIPFGTTRDEVLKLAMSLASKSNHPLSHAICVLGEEEQISLVESSTFTEVRGHAVRGKIDDTFYYLGSKKHALDRGVLSEEVLEQLAKLEEEGNTISVLSEEDSTLALFVFNDQPRENAQDVMGQLKKLGVRTVMLTGDNQGAANNVAKSIGIDEVHATLLPEQKVGKVHELENTYGHIAMVGDGINDAPAMAASSLGISMGAGGTDIAIETSDIALMTDNLERIPSLLRHSKRTMRLIKQNISFSLIVKAIFLILALLKLATLWMAIAADTGASLVVVFNGMRMLRFKR